jgi:hypothetical protein
MEVSHPLIERKKRHYLANPLYSLPIDGVSTRHLAPLITKIGWKKEMINLVDLGR